MTILFKPPSVNTNADPGLQYLTKREISDAYGNVTGTSSTAITPSSSVVLEQSTNYVTNVTQVNPSETVLDLTNLSFTDIELKKNDLKYSVITAEPYDVDRILILPLASDATGHRLILINRSSTYHIIVKDTLSDNIVVVDSQTSEEILSDGYNWITVN